MKSKEARKLQLKRLQKGEKKIDLMTKSLANCTLEENVDTLCTKNSKSVDQVQNLTSAIHLVQNQIKLIEKEKQQLREEQNKEELERSRLLTLCSEWEQKNTSFLDESEREIEEVIEKQKKVPERFHPYYEKANIFVVNSIQTMDKQCEAESNIFFKERESYIAQLQVRKEQQIKFQINIKTLKEHLTLYTGKFRYFEHTIMKTNEIINKLKTEANRMQEQIQNLKKENDMLMDRWFLTQVVNPIGVTENNASCEIPAISKEKSSVLDSVNIDNSKIDAFVCVNVEKQVNLPAEGLSNDQQIVETASPQSVNMDTNINKSKRKILKRKMK